ncbi:MAG: rhodanese-like domain-containing protein [Verrucomicrobia bacterium]|nr:rhodanese-like domain-containing protein [Verrucomicrobiota bacterium]
MMKGFDKLIGVSLAVLCLAGCSQSADEVAQPGVPGPPVPKLVTEVAGSGERAATSKTEPKAPAKKKGSITEVDLNRVLAMQDDGTGFLIDVRPTLFYTMGHLPGAISMPQKSFPLSLVKVQGQIDAAVAAGKVVVVYCQNVECPDGYSVGKKMSSKGYDVSLYKGGWEEWKAMGF